MPNVSFSGNFQPQLTVDSKNQPVPLAFLSTYSQKSMDDLVFTTPQTNTLIGQGTITTPSVVLIMCEEGEFDVAFDVLGSAGTGVIKLNASGVPVPTYKPFFMFFTPDPSATKFYITTPGPARGKVWIFQ